MKKIIALILMTVICLSLCSCDIIKEYLPDFANGGKKDPEQTKDTTVTEEEWNAAIGIGNYTLNSEVRVHASATAPNGESMEMEETSTDFFECDGIAEHNINTSINKETFNNNTEERSNTSEGYHEIRQDDGEGYSIYYNESTKEWIGRESSRTSATEVIGRVLGTLDGTIKGSEYDNYLYDEEKKAYVRSIENVEYIINSVSIDEVKMYVYFEDNKIVRIEAVGSDTQELDGVDENGDPMTVTMNITLTLNVVISNHGTTTVTVPEYTTEEY